MNRWLHFGDVLGSGKTFNLSKITDQGALIIKHSPHRAAWGRPARSECFSSWRSVFLSARCCCSQDSERRCSPRCIDWLWTQNDCRTSPRFGCGPGRWPLTACIPTSCISLTSPTLFLSSDEAENAQERCGGHRMAYFFWNIIPVSVVSPAIITIIWNVDKRPSL